MANQQKVTCLMILGSFAMLICLLAFMSMNARESPNSTPDQAVLFGVIAVGSIIACLGWTWLKVWPRSAVGDEPKPVPAQQFQTALIVGLSFAEIPGLLGFTMAPVLHELRFAFFGASLACMLLALLPAALRYWRLAEEAA